MSGSETVAKRFQETRTLMAKVDGLLARAGRKPFANTPPSREPKIGGEPELFSKQEVESLLSKEATGWDQRVKDILGIPDKLLISREATNVLFSEHPAFGVANVYSDLAHARVPTAMPAYGIAIDGSGIDSVYFVLTDPTRRIIVREPLSCIHSPTDSEWQAIAAKIEQAVEYAKRAPEGYVAIVNGGFPDMIPIKK